jgi:hypothetical protein
LYEDNNLFPEYQERVDNEFKYDPLSKFVQDLRRYCQHFKSPIVMFRTTADGNGRPIRNISIPLDDLQAFKDWSAPAKKYLRTKVDPFVKTGGRAVVRATLLLFLSSSALFLA